MARSGSYCADQANMRYFVVLALIVGGLIFWRQQATQKEEPEKAAQVAAHPTLTPRPASEHDWAKAAIDRTNEVRQQVKRERASNEVP